MTREEAIKALEARLRSDDVVYVGDISYPEALSMAIEALKAQEPMIISLKDVVCAEDGRVVWLETYFDGNTVIEPFLACVDFTQKPVIINGWHSFINLNENDLADSIVSIISDRFKVRKFRFWSAYPTDEQREAVAWQ